MWAKLDKQFHDPDAGKRFKQRLGKCYELAGHFVSRNHDCTLVHGSIQGFDNPRIKHAWVELPDGRIYEAVAGKVIDAVMYDVFFNPIEDQRYDYMATLRATCQHGYWGAWGDKENHKKMVALFSACANVKHGKRKRKS